jgi:hypothetical protein
MCVSGHCAPQPRFSYFMTWGTYDMWMFWGSRAWSQCGVAHHFYVLLACRKFWFSRKVHVDRRLFAYCGGFRCMGGADSNDVYGPGRHEYDRFQRRKADCAQPDKDEISERAGRNFRGRCWVGQEGGAKRNEANAAMPRSLSSCDVRVCHVLVSSLLRSAKQQQ